MAKKQPNQQYMKIDTRPSQVTAPGGELANYFLRNIPLWNPPAWQTAEVWRQFVLKQPIAAICRDTIANYLNSLDWAIVARDSDQRDELKGKIKYYTHLFERGNAYYYDIDFAAHVEWAIKDLFDLPFGFACELGRINDDPNGKVVWIRPLDGGTLAPTLNFDYPIVQVAPNTGLNPVYVPRDFVSRIYLSPRTELRREGWGFAPPERIYLALEMLYRGDSYYAQLLMNTPEAGVLDLGDIEKETAESWVASVRDILYGINPLKIPVLYEHTTTAKWIPFGRPPSDIMYDSITMKYASVVCAGYGLTLSDIGMQSGAGGRDSLAGVIRMERVAMGSGKAIAKKKMEGYFNKILPEVLKFEWIDYDDERNVSKGRARLASAQAGQIWVQQRVFLPSEIRQQAIADGLVSISVPETINPNDKEFAALPQGNNPFSKIGGSKPKSLGNPVNPSQGGQGEIIPQQTIQRNLSNAEVGISKAVFNAIEIIEGLISNVKRNLSSAEVNVWEQYVDEYLTGKSDIEDELRDALDAISGNISNAVNGQEWIVALSSEIAQRVLADIDSYNKYRKEYADQDGVQVESLATDESQTLFTVQKSLSEQIAILSLLHLKSKMLSSNGVDPTEKVGDNVRVSREVASEVLKVLPEIIKSAYEDGMNNIGE